MSTFRDCFNFQPHLASLVGVEREGFLVRNGEIVPIAHEILPHLNNPAITNEFSDCQLEDRVGPSPIHEIRSQLEVADEYIKTICRELNFEWRLMELAPDTMPVVCYPDPENRYDRLMQHLSPRAILAAHQVAGTHVHIGMTDHDHALRAYNNAVKHYYRLCQMGDGSNGRRLELYGLVAPNSIPPPYASWEAFEATALSEGFYESPRKCYHLIRISVHGTIEFRMFGATPDLDAIESWVNECHRLCT